MQSKVGWGVPLTLSYHVCHKQSTKGFTSQWSFQQIKKVILHASWRPRYIYIYIYVYTMACNANAAAAIGSWISQNALIDDEISARIGKASGSFGKLTKRLWSERGVRLVTKIWSSTALRTNWHRTTHKACATSLVRTPCEDGRWPHPQGRVLRRTGRRSSNTGRTTKAV